MDIKIRYTDKKCNKIKVMYKRNQVLEFLHTLHENSKEKSEYGLYDVKENSRNVSLIFNFENEIDNFEGVVRYINSLYAEYRAKVNRLELRDKLERKMQNK